MIVSPPQPVAVLYKGHSDFDSLNTMVGQWAAALRARGVRPEIVDLRRAGAVARTVGLIRGGRVVLFLSVNGYGVPEPGQGPGFYRESAAPLFVFFTDHPIYHHPTIRSEAPHLLASFPTPGNLEFCRGRIRGDRPLLHLPHAAAPGPAAPWPERDIPVLVAGSLHQDPERTRAGWIDHGAAERDRLEDILAAHAVGPGRPLHDIVLEVLERPGGPPIPLERLHAHFQVVDGYLRSAVRLDFLRAAGALPVALVGRGWDGMLPAGTPVRLLGERPVAGLFGLMARAKIVLNLLPPYYESHERPFQAMAHGAAAATVAAPWLLEAVGAGALRALPPDAGAAAAGVGAALADDAGLEALAARGRAAFLSGHTWDHRLARLLDWIEDVT